METPEPLKAKPGCSGSGCLLWLGGVIAMSLALLEVIEFQSHQSWLPQGVEAPIEEYEQISFPPGIGPGGQDTGIIILRMTDLSAERVSRGGLPYLEQSWSEFADWKETPVNPMWSGHGEHTCGREPGIGAFLDYGDFRCRMKPQVVDETNRIISAPGAYYASGSAGRLIIVAPRERKVILAFNG